MDNVHALRTQYRADLVAMIIDDSQYCDIAYLGTSQSYMFSVTAWNCATSYYSSGTRLDIIWDVTMIKEQNCMHKWP